MDLRYYNLFKTILLLALLIILFYFFYLWSFNFLSLKNWFFNESSMFIEKTQQLIVDSTSNIPQKINNLSENISKNSELLEILSKMEQQKNNLIFLSMWSFLINLFLIVFLFITLSFLKSYKKIYENTKNFMNEDLENYNISMNNSLNNNMNSILNDYNQIVVNLQSDLKNLNTAFNQSLENLFKDLNKELSDLELNKINENLIEEFKKYDNMFEKLKSIENNSFEEVKGFLLNIFNDKNFNPELFINDLFTQSPLLCSLFKFLSVFSSNSIKIQAQIQQLSELITMHIKENVNDKILFSSNIEEILKNFTNLNKSFNIVCTEYLDFNDGVLIEKQLVTNMDKFVQEIANVKGIDLKFYDIFNKSDLSKKYSTNLINFITEKGYTNNKINY